MDTNHKQQRKEIEMTFQLPKALTEYTITFWEYDECTAEETFTGRLQAVKRGMDWVDNADAGVREFRFVAKDNKYEIYNAARSEFFQSIRKMMEQGVSESFFIDQLGAPFWHQFTLWNREANENYRQNMAGL